MENQFIRTEMLLGRENLIRLSNTRVAVFGIGGVGGYTVEALVRSGIGELDMFDGDIIETTNLNRQIIATHKTLGMPKTQAAARRARDINPNIRINEHNIFFSGENSQQFDFTVYDYVVDAIDRVSDKLEIIEKAKAAGVPVISCMGTGNKIDPTALEVCDIYSTSICPLAKVMRHELRKRGIKELKVVCSKEKPIRPVSGQKDRVPGSFPFVPAAAGMIIASAVIRDLTNL